MSDKTTMDAASVEQQLKLARELAKEWSTSDYYNSRPNVESADATQPVTSIRQRKRNSKRLSLVERTNSTYWRRSVIMDVEELEGVVQDVNAESMLDVLQEGDEEEEDDDSHAFHMDDDEASNSITDIHRRLSDIRAGRGLWGAEASQAASSARRNSLYGLPRQVPEALLKDKDFADNIEMEFYIDRLLLLRQCHRALRMCKVSSDKAKVIDTFSAKRRALATSYHERLSRLLTYQTEMNVLVGESVTRHMSTTRALFNALKRGDIRNIKAKHERRDRVVEAIVKKHQEHLNAIGPSEVARLADDMRTRSAQRESINQHEVDEHFKSEQVAFQEQMERSAKGAMRLDATDLGALRACFGAIFSDLVKNFQVYTFQAMGNIASMTEESLRSTIDLRAKHSTSRNIREQEREVLLDLESAGILEDRLLHNIDRFYAIRKQRADELVIEGQMAMHERRRNLRNKLLQNSSTQ